MVNQLGKSHTKISSHRLYDWSQLRSFNYWKELFIYFWVFSIVGHYIEVIWTMTPLSGTWHPIIKSFIPIAAPYGIGAVAVIILVWPLIKVRKSNPLLIFMMCTIIASVVEYQSALFTVAIWGHNQFWSYANHPYNINGYISLDSSLVLGLMATIFLYFVYPTSKKIFARLNKRWVNITFWIMLISYVIDLTNSYLI